VPTIAAGSVIFVTKWLQLAFHDLRPGMASSHCPSVGDATGMMSADTFSSHDLAAAIAVPPANNRIFLPCNIIVFRFIYADIHVRGLPTKKAPEPLPRLAGSGLAKNHLENCNTNNTMKN
jgi:hypothetical protein